MDIESGGGFPAQRPDPAQSKQDDPICWYLTVVGHQVTVSLNGQGAYRYHCEGCNVQEDRRSERAQVLSEANEHASRCRAMSSRRAKDVEDIARELYADVRAELPRIDARAAAGIAISGAVLIGAVGQAQPMPIPGIHGGCSCPTDRCFVVILHGFAAGPFQGITGLRP